MAPSPHIPPSTSLSLSSFSFFFLLSLASSPSFSLLSTLLNRITTWEVPALTSRILELETCATTPSCLAFQHSEGYCNLVANLINWGWLNLVISHCKWTVFKNYFFYVYAFCLYLGLCIIHMWCFQNPEAHVHLLELKLPTAVSCHIGAGSQVQVFLKNRQWSHLSSSINDQFLCTLFHFQTYGALNWIFEFSVLVRMENIPNKLRSWSIFTLT